MRKTFKTKALLVTIPVLVVVSLVHTVVSIKREQSLVRREIMKRAETITTLATKTGELPILSGNPELLKGTVAFLKNNSEVSSVTFYDAARRELIRDGAELSLPLPASVSARPLSVFEEGDQIVYFAPVFTERSQSDMEILQDPDQVKKVRDNIGWIRLGFSKLPMREQEGRIVAQGLLLAFGFSAASSLLVYFLISLATRPLTRIVMVANGIAHGDLDQEVEGGRGDEIAILAEAFGTMKNTIQQVLRETETLIVAVRGGHLEVRSNPEPFEGEWRKLVCGVNDLTDAFAKAHDELREAKDAAEAADRTKSEFLANMSHELRTPLNAILGYAQLLSRQESLSVEQSRQVEVMRSSGEHLLALINDILDVGKIEAQRMELEEHPFNLALLMHQVLNITGVNAEGKGLQFRYEAVGELPEYLKGDERKLRQVLLNLLSNAVKYTPRGSVTLKVGYLGEGAGLFWCEVIDTGIGIASERIDTIFEPFIQLGSSRQVSEGTGLGLTITKRLAGLMRGRVGVESEPGQGSTFRLEVPLSRVTDPVSSLQFVDFSVTGYRGERKRILVVGESADNTAVLVSLLQPLGFALSSACGPEEALDQVTRHPTDLVLMDLVLPGPQWVETLRALRRESMRPEIRIICASASGWKDSIASVCDDYIVKPLRVDLLLEKVGAQLDLFWETAAPEAPLPSPETALEAPLLLETPPREQLEELHRLALLGDMRKVAAYAERIGEGGAYSPFVALLSELAGSFRTKAIVDLVERHLYRVPRN
jgi:signal transduction histidine kinase/ActR/RegA family two-component response regulator